MYLIMNVENFLVKLAPNRTFNTPCPLVIHYPSHETGQAIGHLIPSRRAHKSLSRLSPNLKKQLPG